MPGIIPVGKEDRPKHKPARGTTTNMLAVLTPPPLGRRFLSTTTATNYSLVGSLNKIPVALIGLVAFNVPWSSENLASILVGLLAGIIFVKAKQLPVPATSTK